MQWPVIWFLLSRGCCWDHATSQGFSSSPPSSSPSSPSASRLFLQSLSKQEESRLFTFFFSLSLSRSLFLARFLLGSASPHLGPDSAGRFWVVFIFRTLTRVTFKAQPPHKAKQKKRPPTKRHDGRPRSPLTSRSFSFCFRDLYKHSLAGVRCTRSQ